MLGVPLSEPTYVDHRLFVDACLKRLGRPIAGARWSLGPLQRAQPDTRDLRKPVRSAPALRLREREAYPLVGFVLAEQLGRHRLSMERATRRELSVPRSEDRPVPRRRGARA